MKKNPITLILLVLAFLTIFLSCKKEEPELVGITITSPPDKLAYFVPEELDLTGLVLELSLSDGSPARRSVN